MKKIYITPNTNVTEIKACQMICASEGHLSTDAGDSIGDSNDFGSRSFTLWDDEEE